jgi:hypothetical protein
LASEVIVAKSPPSNVMPMKRPAGEVATPTKKPAKKVVVTHINWGNGTLPEEKKR